MRLHLLALSLALAGLAGLQKKKKKPLKKIFTSNPSSNAMNYVKFTAVMAGSIALKQYLEDQKILPDNI